MRDRIMKNHQLIYQYGSQFGAFFNANLKEFFDFTGFDIVKFDGYIKTPKGQSCRDYLQKQYGAECVTMIESLIKG